ncbi:MAG: transpeptidase family protein [Paludibacteraceae bacterium]|nr:transpeptidase family protein [Paludibacteraceae bacterium]
MALRKSIVKRFEIVYWVIVAFFALAVFRMGWIMTVERSSWMAEAKKLEKKEREIVPERGNLYAADGSLITATIPYYNLYMDAKIPYFGTKKGQEFFRENIDSLCICLSQKFKDKSSAEYKDMILKARVAGNRRLKIYSKRVSYLDLMDIKGFPLFRAGSMKSGFYYEESSNRENLYGSLARRTLGDTYGSSGRGQYGLELYYDSLLAGEKGIAKGHLVGRANWVFVPEKEAIRGADIYTTLDIEMQDICETAMRDKLEVIKAKNACVVLMEVKTGEIKAMVNLERAGDGSYFEGRNMAVADMSEPGSTFKTMSLMVALDHGVCDTSDVLNINNGVWMFYNSKMTDHNWHKGGYDSLSVAGILAQSSNVGVSRIIDEYYKKKPMDFINAVLATGFADQLDFGVSGTLRPMLTTPDSKLWSGVTLPWMSIGYATQVPPIYTLNFYNAIANGGKMMRPYLVREIKRDGQVLVSNKPEVAKSSICKSSTLKKVQGMLEGVVEYGTAKTIKSEQFAIAGKTGTAQLGYGKGGVVKHQVSFCGYFPADNPMYSCIVVVKEPQMAPAAAFMCGEVFKKVAERIYAKETNLQMEDMERWQSDSLNVYNLPRVKAGAREEVESAMDELDLNYQRNKSDWVVLSKSQDEAKLIADMRPIVDDLVPNVVGMGAIDAVYLMESCGLHVQLQGKGRVVSQSILNGQKAVRGSTVVLKLR